MTPTHHRAEVSRLIRADRARVYAAWSDPKAIVKWWGAGGVTCTAAEMDLTEGGAYRIANRAPDGSTMWITGTFQLVEPPRHLVYTWAVEPIADDSHSSIVDVRFDESDGGTLVTIVHRQIASAQAREINTAGWTGCLEGLEALLTEPTHAI